LEFGIKNIATISETINRSRNAEMTRMRKRRGKRQEKDRIEKTEGERDEEKVKYIKIASPLDIEGRERTFSSSRGRCRGTRGRL